jgi:hypothetical protein
MGAVQVSSLKGDQSSAQGFNPGLGNSTRPDLKGLRIYISLFVFISLTFHARAHDPGLSSAQVTVGNQEIDVLLGFAEKDAESILPAGASSAGTDTSIGFAAMQSELESVATNAFSLYWDKQPAVPRMPTYSHVVRTTPSPIPIPVCPVPEITCTVALRCGSQSGLRFASISTRLASRNGGRASLVPSLEASSSTANPGPSVANSKRISFGSRK